MKVTMGGSTGRLVAAGLCTYAVLALTPLSRPGFVIGLGLVYLSSLVLEVVYVHRRARSRSG